MKKSKLLLSVLAFFFLLQLWVAAPAQADWVVGIGNLQGSCVQFDWRGGTASYSGSGAGQFTVDVNNTFDNTIGGGSTSDSWSIWVNDQQVVSSTVIERSQVSVPVSDDWTVTVQGIDVGFWAGWYGTQFCNPVFTADEVVVVDPVVPVYTPAPIPTGDYRLDEGWGAAIAVPAGMVIDRVQAWYGDPNDGNNGADWSAQYTEQLHGLSVADLNSGNYFGDPVPGVYKVLIATVFFVTDPNFVSPVQPLPSPEPTITPDPSPSPVVEPPVTVEPTPEPTVDPVPEIVVSSSDVRPEIPPVQEVVVIPEPAPVPIVIAPVVIPEPVVVPPVVEPIPQPIVVPPVIVPEPVVSPPIIEPAPVPVPEPVVVPAPDPAPIDVRPEEPPVTEVVPEPVVEPVVEPSPTPTEPVIEPSPSEPVVEPSPTPSETEAPASPEPTPSEPTVAPSLPAIPDPTTEPSAEPKPVIVPAPPVREPVIVPTPPHEETVKPEPVTAQTLTLPDNPSPQEISAVISEANTILDSAVQGSPEYEKALEVLAEAAVADDPEVPEELLSIPGVGQAAVAVLQAFNALGNLGADISPAVRKKSKQVGSAVIVVGIAASSGAAVRRK
jgi:hypothetical protein